MKEKGGEDVRKEESRRKEAKRLLLTQAPSPGPSANPGQTPRSF